MKINFVLVTFSFLCIVANAIAQDTLKLPFAIAKEKRLSDDDLKNKKEGLYFTGIPDLSSDPLNGFGAGVEGQLFFNGKKTDPFFAYSPYRAMLSMTAFYTTKSQREFRLEFEIPYVFNTKWRLHGELGYELNPNRLYFGVTEKSLNPLSYFPDNDPSRPIVNNASYSDYQNSLTGKKAFYNTYQVEEAIMNFILERSFWQGRMRFFTGFELAKASYTTPLNDSSLLHQDALAGKVLGYGNVLVPIYQLGLIYDTRDLETDPSEGVFAELVDEMSPSALGSQFNFNKIFLHYKYFHKILPEKLKKCVFAGWIGISMTQGDAPFFEYHDAESSERTVYVLGGSQTLRGFKDARFVAKVMSFADFELRYRFGQCKLLKQHLTFSGVPFIDLGGAWDDLSRISYLNNLRYSEGLGLRIGWNENTVLRFDYAVSKEDQQFFFGLMQPF